MKHICDECKQAALAEITEMETADKNYGSQGA